MVFMDRDIRFNKRTLVEEDEEPIKKPKTYIDYLMASEYNETYKLFYKNRFLNRKGRCQDNGRKLLKKDEE